MPSPGSFEGDHEQGRYCDSLVASAVAQSVRRQQPCTTSGPTPQKRSARQFLALLFALGTLKGGRSCQTNLDCSNHGTCEGYRAAAGRGASRTPAVPGTCACDLGYSGPACMTDSCARNGPCGNHGTCIRNAGASTCTCAAGYVGPTCATNACEPNPCRNQGICQPSVSTSGFTCSCRGYSGDICDTPNQCNTMMIENTVEGSTTCAGSTGEECSYTCADGFAATAGNSGHTACGVDGTFTHVECIGQQCSPYHIPFSDKASGIGCVGTTTQSCQVQCDQGYSLAGDGGNGNTAVACLPTGAFETTDCIPNTCQSYPIDHSVGDTVCTGHTTDVCEYACLPGFTDSGSGQTQCEPSGEFAGGECNPNPCAPYPIAHSDHSTNNPCTGAMDDVCSYICDAGYHLMPNDQASGSVTCLETARFEEATCMPKSCPSYFVTNADPPTTCDGTVTETCAFVCAQGCAKSSPPACPILRYVPNAYLSLAVALHSQICRGWGERRSGYYDPMPGSGQPTVRPRTSKPVSRR